jgi:thiamine transport system permease protein
VIGMGLIGVIAWVVGGVFSRAVLEGSGLWANVLALAGRGARDILNVSVVDAVGNSLRNMVVALAVSLILAWLLSTKRVGLAVLLPLGISPVVLGLAALVVSGYLPVWASGSWVLLPLVQSIFLTPLAFQIIAPARRAFSSELREAAVLDGAKRWQVASFVELPILAKPLTAATALVSLASLGEFGAARFLAYGSDQTLPLVMFRLMSRPGGENLGMAMVAASAFIVLAAVAVWVISAVGQREHESSDHG